MTVFREQWTPNWRRIAVVAGVALGLLLLAARAGGGQGGRPAAAPAEPTWTQASDAPVVLDTPANLQTAFTNELNARERYVAYARRADAEGYAAVARLFRACAKAESIHAYLHVQAIARTGQSARAVLGHVTIGTTAENLQTALGCEKYEIETWYPALIAQARADHQAMALRSLTLALGAERDHFRLLTQACERLEARPVAGAVFVCPHCGRTVSAIEFDKCPGCYTAASRFLRLT